VPKLLGVHYPKGTFMQNVLALLRSLPETSDATLAVGLVTFAVLLGMMLFYGFMPSATALWLPLYLVLAMATSLGAALWLSAINVQYRDVTHVMPFLIQVWLFATPIAYPSSLLGQPWRTLYGLNPMAGVVEGFRWALLGSGNAPGRMALVSFAIALVLLVSGAFYFRRMERRFADVI